MDDVFRHFVVSPRDEDLLSENSIVIALGHRPGANPRQVGSGLGFGEIHRAGPAAAHHVFEKFLLQFRIAVIFERFDGGHAEDGTDGKAEVGGRPHFGCGAVDGVGQAHSTEAGIRGTGAPAAFGKLPVGFGESRGFAHLPVNEPGRVGLAGAVQRGEHVFGKFRGLFQNGGNEFRAGVLERRFAADFIHSRQLAQKEPHLLQWRPIGHRQFSNFSRKSGAL